MRFNFLAFISILLSAIALQIPAYCSPPMESHIPIPVAQPFDRKDVRLLPGFCKTEQDMDARYLLSLSPDSLLRNFRFNASLPAPGKPLEGWEEPGSEVRGHFVGHYMSACALMYCATGNYRFKRRGELIVFELDKCQKAMKTGYLSAFPASFFDKLEQGKPVWAPYYTIHKIMQGLLDMYLLCGDDQALRMAQREAHYFWRRDRHFDNIKMQMMLQTEFGGIADTLWHLYAITGDIVDAELAKKFEKQVFLGPLAIHQDDLDNIHANTHIPQVLGAARRYDVTGNPIYRSIVSYFWKRVADHRSYATGGNNLGEFWQEPDKLAHTLSSNNEETCTTYNMLKVTRKLFEWTANPSYADFYERAYFNGMLPAQNPRTGMMIYYLPLASGYTKSWGTPTGSFWCCYGTGIESFAKLNDSIYFHNSDTLFVNLYVASRLNWRAKGIQLTQQTSFPNTDHSLFTFHSSHPAQFTLALHLPYWAIDGVVITVNGRKISTRSKPSSYAKLTRVWRDADRVEITLPMSFHSDPMPDNSDMKAILYGPLVLAGVLHPLLNQISNYGKNYNGAEYLPASFSDIHKWLKPTAKDSMTFHTEGLVEHFTLMPLYRIINQPYAVYWYMPPIGSSEQISFIKGIAEEKAKAAELKARTVDSVQPGVRASETGHNLAMIQSGSGIFDGRSWRDASGWFSYDLKVQPTGGATLLCTYWGSDNGNRIFDILVNGQRIASQTLQNNHPGKFIQVQYPIPQSLTQGRNEVTIRFQAQPGKTAGGLFGLATLKEHS